MNVCFCLNNLGAVGLGATLNSLIKHCSNAAKLQLYFLCSGVNENIKRAIAAELSELKFAGSFKCIDFDPYDTFKNYRPLQNDWTAYGRLLIADIIHEKQVVYLDADLLIQTDILKIHDTGIEDFTIAAVVSGNIKYSLEHEFFIQTLKLNPYLQVFNSGVLLINTEAWKKEDIKSKLLKIANEYPGELLSADQTLLNAIFAGNFFPLPSKYNVYWYPDKEPDVKQDCIYHFVGSPKPWDFFGKYLHSGYKKWNEYNSRLWRKNVSGKFQLQQLQRFWAIKKSYIKIILKNKLAG